MATDVKPNARQLYLQGLQELAAQHGNEYALQTAATTMANLLAMVSMAMYRLSNPPLFLPPEAPPTKRKKH
ncbi:hypothetical protein AB4Y96_15950 [Phyllobacterium sp. TAF24]|uniref:hypothetical protein n=1 Tax=Phyllobacterium sp. TAF24 TaxID=3233068 RepID=UPI003F9C5F89